MPHQTFIFLTVFLLVLTMLLLFLLAKKRRQNNSLQQENFQLKEQNKFLNQTLTESKTTADVLKQEIENSLSKVTQSIFHTQTETFFKMAEQNFSRYEKQASTIFEKENMQFGALVKPIRDSIHSIQDLVNKSEKERIGAFSHLSSKIDSLSHLQAELQKETQKLRGALRASGTRGRWGEIQLRRTVEIAGLINYCDFFEQSNIKDHEAKDLRPDMVVRLPQKRFIVVDAKAPLDAYLKGFETEGDRRPYFKEHAASVRQHAMMLSKKSYWSFLEDSPEFVIMFLPGESFLSVALEADPSLLELSTKNNVLVATPITLIALLKTVALGWKQENVAEEAKNILQMGQTLYERLGDFSRHMENVGTRLEGTVKAYNQGMGSLRSRLMPSARKLAELGMTDSKKSADLKDIETLPKANESPNL